MSKKIIRTPNAAQPVGPYNQGVILNGHVIFTAGQIPLDPGTGQMVAGGIQEQTEMALRNLKAIVEAGGSGLDRVIKTTVYLKDLNDFGGMNEVYAKHFAAATAPARTTVQVARLPKDALVEIEAVAVV
jgi:2-iminobutanoate/2-iminopropanoate deaminase